MVFGASTVTVRESERSVVLTLRLLGEKKKIFNQSESIRQYRYGLSGFPGGESVIYEMN